MNLIADFNLYAFLSRFKLHFIMRCKSFFRQILLIVWTVLAGIPEIVFRLVECCAGGDDVRPLLDRALLVNNVEVTSRVRNQCAVRKRPGAEK